MMHKNTNTGAKERNAKSCKCEFEFQQLDDQEKAEGDEESGSYLDHEQATCS